MLSYIKKRTSEKSRSSLSRARGILRYSRSLPVCSFHAVSVRCRVHPCTLFVWRRAHSASNPYLIKFRIRFKIKRTSGFSRSSLSRARGIWTPDILVPNGIYVLFVMFCHYLLPKTYLLRLFMSMFWWGLLKTLTIY